ncbi:MAG: GNAT family N-acetyltransferase [Sphingomonadaceae bacterium]
MPEIRAFEEGDWPSIWPIFHHVTAAGDTYTYATDMNEAAARAIWIEHPPGHTVVARDTTGRVIGTAKMGPNKGGPGAHVATASFMVDPNCRGDGIGRALGVYALDWARVEGFRAMQFNAVVEANHPAVKLWQSLGFEIIGTVPEAFAHPRDGLVGLHIMYQRL